MDCFLQRILKGQARGFLLLFWMINGLFANKQNITGNISFSSLKVDQADSNQTAVFYRETVPTAFEFHKSLDLVIEEFQIREKIELNPNNFPKIVIKLDTSASPGLQVSIGLLDGLLELLKNRGYEKEKVELVCFQLEEVRRAKGYRLISEMDFYKGHLVSSPKNLNFFEPDWFHDSPMPPKVHDRAKFYLQFPNDRKKRMEEERKSYLPSILLQDQVYWINLATVMDDSNLGILGASSNMSIGMASNTRRFAGDPTLGAAAVTEILAIPEIWKKRIFSVLDLSRYQFAGGGDFNAEFLGSHHAILLSRNPFAVDSVAWGFLAQSRERRKFTFRTKENALIFKYAESLGLGVVMNPEVFRVP